MRRPIIKKAVIEINQSKEGETIEAKVRRIVNNKEPIADGAALIYQEAKDGVQAQYDIRADKWNEATKAMDKVAQEQISKKNKGKVVDIKDGKEKTGGETGGEGDKGGETGGKAGVE